MIDLKRERMGEFIWNARSEIESLWNELMTGEDERADFAAFADGRYPPRRLCHRDGVHAPHTDEHTEDLLSQHEHEIVRLKAEVRLKTPMLASIKKYFDICEEEKELERAAGDQTRLLGRGRDPGRLLREEKMRKRVGKEKPKVRSWVPQSFVACLITRCVAGTAIAVVPSRMGAGQWPPLPGAWRKYAPDSDGECICERTREQEEDSHIAILNASTQWEQTHWPCDT